MIGAMIGVREASHFEVDVWPTLPRRGEAAVRIVARLGILAFAVVFLVGGIEFTTSPGTAPQSWPTCHSG